METIDKMGVGRRSLLKGSAAVAGLWPLPSLVSAAGRDAEKLSSVKGVEMTRDGNVALIVLNRPSQGNLLDERDHADLLAAFRAADADASIQSIVLAGRGEHFSTGIASSPSQVAAMSANEPKRLSAKPMVVAVQGQTAGLGVALALSADIRVASADAVFGWPDPRHAEILRLRLIEELGRGNAQRFLLTGQSLDAHEAWRLGLVQHIAANPTEALHEATSIAQAIARRRIETSDLA